MKKSDKELIREIADIRIGFWNHNQWRKVYKSIGRIRAKKIIKIIKETI